jgi:hypothetical protein
MPGRKGTLVERFWSKVIKRGRNECWGWTGACSQKKPDRYPNMSKGSRSEGTILACRVALLVTVGPPPDEERIEPLHRCHNSECVNPGHLEWGTHSENEKQKWVTRKDREKRNRWRRRRAA